MVKGGVIFTKKISIPMIGLEKVNTPLGMGRPEAV